jgi:KRAB domain-containing zinc finger protein
MDVPARQNQAHQVVVNVQRKQVEKEYKCLECGKIFPKYINLYQHKKIHEGIIYRCVQCPSTYKSISGLKFHSNTQHELRQFECHHCQTTFQARGTLKRHLTMHFNSIEKEYKCLECGKIFPKYINLYQHKKIHEGIIYRCAQCPSTYKQKYGLHHHLTTVHEVEVVTDIQRKKVEKEYKCLECGNVFSNYYQFYKHKKMHEGRIYRCVQCPSIYKTKHGLHYHVRTVHEVEVVTDVQRKKVEKEYKCLECGNIFSNYYQFYKHKKMHEGIIYRCVQCPSIYKSKNGLKFHVRTVHEVEVVTDVQRKEYKCVECGKIFLNYQKFYQHKKMHEGIIRRCAQCPSTYKSRSGLKYHSKTHRDLRQFECHHCHTTFTTKISLITHMTEHFNSIEKE